MDLEKNENNDNIDDVYGSLPQDVVRALMASHPLKGGNTEDAFPTSAALSREELRAARKKRLEKMKEEDYEQEDMPVIENPEKYDLTSQTSNDDEYGQNIAPPFIEDDEDMVQLVRHKSRQKSYKRGAPAATSNTAETAVKRINAERIPHEASERRVKAAPKAELQMDDSEGKYIEINTPEDSKRALDSFFANNDNTMSDYEEKGVHKSNVMFLVAAALAVVVVVLGVLNVSTAGKLTKANETIAGLEDFQSKNEELKLSILSLEEELATYKTSSVLPSGDLPTDEVAAGQTTPTTGQTPAPTTPTTPAPAGEFDTYTVVAGDSFWTIASKVYGNGTQFQKILDANNLTENSPIKAGEKLKIPK